MTDQRRPLGFWYEIGLDRGVLRFFLYQLQRPDGLRRYVWYSVAF